MKWLLLLLLITPVMAQEDLENPALPSTYRSGFFGADFRALSTDTPLAYAAWVDPGDDFCRVKYATNCDGSEATALQISSANTTWGNMSQCNRWRLRLHHTAEIRWEHVTNDKLEVTYSTNIPLSKKAQIINCLVPDEFEFLGQTFSAVCTKLDGRATDLCAKFFPGRPPNIAEKTMDTVVLGWEDDSQ